MKHSWENIKLEKALTQYKEFIEVPEPIDYKKLSVKLYGKGVVLDGVVDGANLKMKRHQLAKAGQIILSEIWGKKGAIGVVPNEGEGALCTSHFFLFDTINEIIEARYFHFILLSNILERQLFEVAQGTTGYAATRPKDFLNTVIPLPPLPEQQRIVSKIESIKQRIDQIKKLRVGQEIEIRNLRYSIYCDAENDYKNIPLSELLTFSVNWEKPTAGTIYRQMGIRVWGLGGYERENIEGTQTQYPFFMKVETDDLVINKIWVRNGALAVVTHELNGCFVSTEFPTFKYDHQILNPKWIAFLIKQKKFWELCAEKSFGTSGKNRIKPEEFLRVEIPLPPIEEQNRIVSLLNKLNTVKANHTATEKELAQLMPALLDKAFKGEL